VFHIRKQIQCYFNLKPAAMAEWLRWPATFKISKNIKVHFF